MAFAPIVTRDGNNVAASMGAFQDASGVNYAGVTFDNSMAVYRASILYTLGVATPTAIIVAQGSATKTVRFRSIRLMGWGTTAGVMKMKLSRRSTAGTLGSAVLTAIPTQGKNDTADAASTLTISTVGTANYTTLGTLTSIMAAGVVSFPVAATISAAAPPLELVTPSEKSIVLRGTSEWLTVDGGADGGGDAVPAGGVLLATIVWTEDAS